MSAIYQVFLKMVVAILLGLILRKQRVIDDRSQVALSDLLLKAVLPFTVIASSQYKYTDELARAVGIVAIGSCIYYAISLFVIRLMSYKISTDKREQVVFTTSSVFANTGFLGFPLMMALLPGQGLLLAAIYNLAYNIFFYIFAANMFNVNRKEQDEKMGVLKTIKSLVFNPVAIASIAAVVLFVIPYRFPSSVLASINLIGDMTVPLSMIILGCTLAKIEIKNLFVDVKMYAAVVMRMLILPAIMFGIIYGLNQFMDIPEVASISMIVITALPAGTMNVIYAEKYNCAPKFAARIVVMTLLVTFVTIPILTDICLNLFPVG